MSGNLVDIVDVPKIHKEGARLMGLDLGSKTIGIAISDTRLKVASARETLQRKKFGVDAEKLLTLAAQEDIFAFVLGLPLNMDGSEGARAQSTRAFARNLANVSDLPIILWDERLSTVAAERAMLDADISRKKRAKKVDAVAAAFILQGALDRIQKI